MTRVFIVHKPRATIAILLFCAVTLALSQLLSPTARLNAALSTDDAARILLAIEAPQASSPQAAAAPSRHCLSIKLAPLDMKSADLAVTGASCRLFVADASATPLGIALSVPTPPPRAA